VKNIRLWTSGTVAIAAIVVALVVVGAASGPRDRHHSRLATGVENLQSYPTEWVSTLEIARERVGFSVFVPSTAAVNEQSLSATYLFPGGSAIAMDFPLVRSSTSPVRQEYIEVWEGPWSFDVEPLKLYQEDIAADPTSKKIIAIEGVDVFTVDAHSPSDDDRANPAFLRFRLDGTDVQISGGDHIDDLLEIAQSIIAEHTASA
jgi:hypothetical protein